MDNLPIEMLERILSYKDLSLADVSNVLQTCKYLRRTIQGSNIIWKHVFAHRWPDLLSMINPEEVADWFDEVQHFINLRSRIANMCAHMASCLHMFNTLIPSDFSELKQLAESRRFNNIYIGKQLSFLRSEKCDINSISAVPCSTIGSLTLRYYADLAYYHFHQENCTKELTELFEMPEKFRTHERYISIITRLLHSFENIKYEDIRKELDRLSIEAQDELRNLNPRHPLFSISQDVQSSWKDQTFECNIFERSHVLEVLQAVETVLYEKLDFDSIPYISKVLNTGEVIKPRLGSIFYESICRRLGVHCEHCRHYLNGLHDFHMSFLKIVCSGPDGVTLYIDPSKFEFCDMPCYSEELSSHWVMSNMLDELEKYFSRHPKNKSMLKIIERLRIVLNPEDKDYCFDELCEYPKLSFRFRSYYSDADHRIYNHTFESWENKEFASLRRSELKRSEWKNSMKKKYFHDRPIPTGECIFPIGSIVVFNCHCSNKGVVVGSTPFFDRDYVPMWKREVGFGSLSNETFYFVIDDRGEKYYISKDNLRLNENTSPLHNSSLYLGRYLSHFFVNHYVPNEHTRKLYPNDEKYRLEHYQQLLIKKKKSFWNKGIQLL